MLIEFIDSRNKIRSLLYVLDSLQEPQHNTQK